MNKVNTIGVELAKNVFHLPQGVSQVRSNPAGILEGAGNELTDVARMLFDELRQELYELDNRVKQVDKKIQRLASKNRTCERLMGIPGVGPMISTALISAVGDANNVNNGRELSAWLGSVPRQHSTGGKPHLLGICKRGDNYVRSLLVQGATCFKGRQDSQLIWSSAVT